MTSSQQASAAPRVTIVVPTLNEAANVAPLLERINSAMAPSAGDYEVLVIDDRSTDGTADVCRRLAGRFPVVCHVRESASGGLSGAVLYGIARARGEVVVVMDADLQHPPRRLPDLIAPLTSGETDFVIGSRNLPASRIAERWGVGRRVGSRIAAALARPLAGPLTDPMSGFFAIRRALVQRARDLNPLGYKIGLELLCKCRVTRVVEIPIDFDLRLHGRSKLTVGQGWSYLRHLVRLYWAAAATFIGRRNPVVPATELGKAG